MRLRVSASQEQSQDLSLNHGDDNLIIIPITEAMKKVGFMSIDFEIFNPIRPKNIGMEDNDPLLGIRLKSGTFY